jgi:hypothetical protein
MVRVCEKCEYINQDDYDYCAKCGTPLVEGLQPKQFYVYKSELPPVNKKALVLAYAATIFLSWIGFFIGLLAKNTMVIAFTFFGFFFPFYLVQSKHPVLRRHGLIMMVISLVGVALSFYVMLK